MRGFFGAVFLGLALSCLMAPKVLAAVMTPEAVTLDVLPAQRAIQTITLENDELLTQKFALELTGIAFGKSADDLRFTELSPESAAWLSLSKSELEILPGQTEVVEVTISVPADAQSRVLSFAVIATQQADESQGIKVTRAVTTLVFTQIGEGLMPNLQVNTFSTVPENVHTSPVKLAALVTNTGTGLSQPTMGIVITNWWGHEVATLPLNSEQKRVPGLTHRVFSTTWQAGPWKFGPYQAQLFVFPDDSGTTLTTTTNMVLFPWQMLSVFALAILVMIAGVIFYQRARSR